VVLPLPAGLSGRALGGALTFLGFGLLRNSIVVDIYSIIQVPQRSCGGDQTCTQRGEAGESETERNLLAILVNRIVRIDNQAGH